MADDPVPENAGAGIAEPSGRAVPVAQRKQQGQTRQFLGAFATEVDAERLVQLKKENLECRQRRERADEQQRKKQEAMAEAWKQHRAEVAAKDKEERRIRLAKLEGQRERSLMLQQSRSLTLSDADEFMDEEYQVLLEKYGDKVRVPTLPPTSLKQHSTCSTATTASAKRESSAKAALPTRPGGRAIKRRLAKPVVAAGGAAARPNLTKRQMAQEVAAEKRGERPQQHTVGAGALPPLSHTLSEDDVDSEVPEPERSLMPRKETLRKFQQALLKKTDVSFYKSHMKKHLRKILEAAEVTFSDHEARKMQGNWNLAKPLTVSEIKQLSAVGVRNP